MFKPYINRSQWSGKHGRYNHTCLLKVTTLADLVNSSHPQLAVTHIKSRPMAATLVLWLMHNFVVGS